MRANGTIALRASVTALPHPSPAPAPQVAAGSMSGEFADRRLASIDGGCAPSIYMPSDRWFHGHPVRGRTLGGRLHASGSPAA